MRRNTSDLGQFDEAVLFVADSRFVYPTRPSAERNFDEAMKIWPFPQLRMIAGFAGEVELAETCLEIIGERIVLNEPHDARDLGELIQEVLRERWPKRRSKMELQLLFGFCDPEGRAELIKFRSETRFAPLHLFGVQTIGNADLGTRFLDVVRRELTKRLEDRKVESQPGAWATILTGVLFEIIQALPEDAPVGGKPVCVFVDKTRIHGWGVKRSRDGVSFEKITLDHLVAKRYKQIHNRPTGSKHIVWEEVPLEVD